MGLGFREPQAFIWSKGCSLGLLQRLAARGLVRGFRGEKRGWAREEAGLVGFLSLRNCGQMPASLSGYHILATWGCLLPGHLVGTRVGAEAQVLLREGKELLTLPPPPPNPG